MPASPAGEEAGNYEPQSAREALRRHRHHLAGARHHGCRAGRGASRGERTLTDGVSNTVSVIRGSTNKVVATVQVGQEPAGVAVNPRTGTIYVADFVSRMVSVIRGSTNKVVATVRVGLGPEWVAVNPRTSTVYVANNTFGTISVIRNNKEVARLRLFRFFTERYAVAVDPVTGRIYITNFFHNTVSVLISCRPDEESCE